MGRGLLRWTAATARRFLSEGASTVVLMIDPMLLDETSCEEEAAWLAAVEAHREEAQAFVRRVTALARGYVLAEQAGRGDLAVADVMGGFAIDRRSAENCLAEALMLVSHPTTLSAVDDGRLGLRHARALMDVLEGLPPELADRVEDSVLAMLATSPGRPPSRVRDLARRVALRLDKDAAVRRRQAAARRRHVRLRDAGDGMVEMVLLLRAEHGLQVLHRAHQQTQHDDGSGRTRDQRQADWMVDRLLAEPVPSAGTGATDGAGTDPGPVSRAGAPARPGTDPVLAGAPAGPTTDLAPAGSALVPDGRRRRPVQVLVHVPVVTALGLADEPCELEEVGPIDADHGRLLLSTAELRKVCVDAVTGRVLHVEDEVVRPVADARRVRELGGTEQARAQATAEAVRQAVLEMVAAPSVMPADPEPQYQPSARLARTVRTRHPRCDFLTCSTPSRAADLEHDRPHDHGGETSAANLTPRSRWCHGAKQRGWKAGLLPDGSTVWQSPSGRSYPAQPQHERPPRLAPDAVLRPPSPPAPRDEDGPEPGDLEWVESCGPPVVEPRHRAREGPAPEQRRPAAPGLAHGWPDDPPF